MRFKKIALALFASMAVGAFAANAAQAAGWTIGTTENQTTAGTLIASGTHQEVMCTKHAGTTLTLESSAVGIPIALKANNIDCLKEAGSSAKSTIDNTTSPNHSEGVLTFTEVMVEEPTACTVAGTLTTAPLTDTIVMDPKSGSGVVFDRYFAEGGTIITITFGGAECPFNGAKVALKGTACGESVSNDLSSPDGTGTLTKVQTLLFGASQQTTGGCALTFGTAAATLKGAVDNELVGTNPKKPFGFDG